MENKATLARAVKEQKRLQEELAQASAEAEEFALSMEQRVLEQANLLRLEYENKKSALKEQIKEKTATTFDTISSMVYTPSQEIEEVSSILEGENLLKSIYSVMSEEQIDAYTPTDIEYLQKEDLKGSVDLLRTYADDLPKEVNYASLFGIFNKLDKCIQQTGDSGTDAGQPSKKDAAEVKDHPQRNKTYTKLIMSALAFIVFLILLTRVFVLLMIMYLLFGILRYYSTSRVTRFLNLYASILESTGNGSSEAAIQDSKDDVLSQVRDHLKKCESTYLKKVDNMQYKEDGSRIAEIKQRLQSEVIAKRMRVDKLRASVESANAEVLRIQRSLELAEKERAKHLLTIEQRYLTYENITWQENLPEDIYLGKDKKGTPVMFPIIHNNVLFVAQEPNELFSFVRLFIMQLMMKVHPDYVSQNVLDYKYMADSLQQFMNLPQRCISIIMEKEKIDTRLSDIGIDVLARNRNILRSVNSIEEFNALMKSYNSVGEGYVFVHLFGVQQINEVYTHLLRNGPKVGYYFYIYLTMEEFKALKSAELLDLTQDYYFIGEMTGVGVYPDKRLRMVMSSYLTTK